MSYSFGTMAGRPGAWISSRLATSFSTSAALRDGQAADVSTPLPHQPMHRGKDTSDSIGICACRMHLNDTLSGSLALTCTSI